MWNRFCTLSNGTDWLRTLFENNFSVCAGGTCSYHVHVVKGNAIYWKLHYTFSRSFAQNKDSSLHLVQLNGASIQQHMLKILCTENCWRPLNFPENWMGEITFDIDKFESIILCSLIPLPWKMTIYFNYDLWCAQIWLVSWAVYSISLCSTRKFFVISNVQQCNRQNLIKFEEKKNNPQCDLREKNRIKNRSLGFQGLFCWINCA